MAQLYRRRLIPDECIPLTDDRILFQSENILITGWNTLHPKTEFAKGISVYILDNGWKISKQMDADGNFVLWYCDIISHDYDKIDDTYIFTDLLADVTIDRNGFVKVIDLDELSDAYERGLISAHLLSEAVRKLNGLLCAIYSGAFEEYTGLIEKYGVRP